LTAPRAPPTLASLRRPNVGRIPRIGPAPRQPEEDTSMGRWLAIIGLGLTPALASADCGWLLMRPPLEHQGEVMHRTARAEWWDRVVLGRGEIAAWVQWSAYDTAAECEAKLEALRARSRETAETAAEADPEQAARQRAVQQALRRARCLPASLVPLR